LCAVAYTATGGLGFIYSWYSCPLLSILFHQVQETWWSLVFLWS